jgi:hypothetical protein
MRASGRDREQTLALLRARCAEGYLSIETFEGRVEQTFAARTVAELHALVDDVTGAGAWLKRSVSRVRRARTAGDDAVPVALPIDGPIVVGRSSGCDVVLSDPTVSRRHRELAPAGPGRWLAVDVGSLNGTWRANRRVDRTVVVRGDELGLGSCPVRLD